ncbi:hypothetical protein ACWGVR_14110 [Streptomyces xanthophaeus]
MSDTRIAAAWRAEECTDEYREFCRCIVVAGEGDRIQYVADAETPELAEQIAAEHNRVITLAQAAAEGVLS